MRKDKLLKETQRQRILEIAGLSSVQGVNLITVDIQPEYEDHIYFLDNYINFLNENIINYIINFLQWLLSINNK